MEKKSDEFRVDTPEHKKIYIELVRTVFLQAYRLGRADGANGIFIDGDLALKIFLEREDSSG